MIRERLATPAERRRAQDFAALVEGAHRTGDRDLESLAALVTSLRPAPLTPDAGFKADLRARLVAEAAAPAAAPAGLVPEQRRAPGSHAAHRIRRGVAAGLAVALIGAAGTAAASTQALPGDALYGLKRGIEDVQLALAGSDLGRGRELLDQARHRLAEAEALAASSDARSPETREGIDNALTDLGADVRAATSAMDSSYRETGDPAGLVELDRFAVEEQVRLRDLMALLDPALRERARGVAELLAQLHNAVTAVTGTGEAALITGTGTTSGRQTLLAVGDGWAVSRLSSRLGTVTGSVSGLTDGGGPQDSGSSSGGDLVGGVTGVTGTVDGVTGTATSSPLGGLVTGGAKTSSTSSPLPSVSDPLPSVALTTAVPTVSVGVPCVPVPPATSC